MLATGLEETTRRNARTRSVDRGLSTSAYYDLHADEYAATTLPLDTSRHIARFASLVRPGGRVLDVGCGSGRDLVRLRDAGIVPEGLELSPALAAVARKTSGLAVTEGDLRRPPYASRSFDGVWAMASLLHLSTHELVPALAALLDILVPGGVLFGSVKRGHGEVVDQHGRWFTLHDEGGWADHLEDAGFEVIEVLGELPRPSSAAGSVSPGWISSLARRP